MKTEKIVLSLIAVLVGILVAGVAFYIYQGTKTIPQSQVKIAQKVNPTPTPGTTINLAVTTPVDESVVGTKTITVAGHTDAGNLVIVSTDTADDQLTPASNGNFTTTVDIADGQNLLRITAIAPDGEEQVITRVVTFSTEQF